MQFSSGDVLADRRADYARMLEEGGDCAAAAELMEQALEVAPAWPAGWLQLAGYREKSGDRQGAAAALERLLELDPEDMFAARLKLALLGAAKVPDVPPRAYVEALFDDYADRFERSLVEKLAYSVPAKLAQLVAGAAPAGRRHALAVDLGCGTGLLGHEIRARIDRLEGFDLSANMLAKAEEKNLYDHLGQADLTAGAEQSGLFGAGLAPHRADLICAADVMMYLGGLEEAFALVRMLAMPGAVFAFSVEDGGDGKGFDLASSLRYVHSQAYVEALLERFGFRVLASEKSVIRKDGENDIVGILFVAESIT